MKYLNELFTLLIFICVFALMGSHSHASYRAQVNTQLERLNAIYLEKDLPTLAVHFKVISNGCTTVKDFEMDFLESEHINRLAIKRTKADNCRKKPKVVTLTKRLRFHEINNQNPIEVKNHLFIR